MKRIHNSSFTAIILAGFLLAIAVSPVSALPPDPDNAALLYYQGFLSLPQLSEEARGHIGDVARGKIVPDDQVREDIGKSTGAIHFAEAAAKVPACNWGVEYSQGFEALMPQMAQMRFMTFVLVADARVRAADGDYKAALERCLMVETFAYHIGNDTFISYLISLSIRNMAYKCIQDVAGQIADNTELLQWLKNELATSSINTLSPVRPLKLEIEIFTDLLRMENIETYARIMGEINGKKGAELASKVDAKILQKARQMFTERMNSAIKVWNTPMLYEQAYSQLKQLEVNFDPNDLSSAAAGAFMPTLHKVFSQKTSVETQLNAITAGIEILLGRARTGRLADTLPSGLPKDAFSGKDFKYEKTKEGFVLHCRDKDLGKNELYQYEFKLSK
jgi:hypothetical protein